MAKKPAPPKAPSEAFDLPMTLAEALEALAPAELAEYRAAVARRDTTPGFLGRHFLDGGRAGERQPNPDRASAETAVGEALRAMMGAFSRAIESRGLRAIGRNGTAKGPEEEIRPFVWRVVNEVDLDGSRAFGPDSTAFVHIEVTARGAEPATTAPTGRVTLKPGRRDTYSWELLLAALAVRVSKDGMPRKLAELVDMVLDEAERRGEACPDASTVAKRVRSHWHPLMEELADDGN